MTVQLPPGSWQHVGLNPTAQHMQPLPHPVYSPDMSPIAHVWDLVGRRLARDPRPAASKDELLLRIQAIFHKQTFKICLTPCHVV
ncbi:uncharacterized protein TNCV_3868601 [Trichonephila clavipes]|nr:uncharacterized protein TNCV_3868601 [Trichonephila clavipes]